jgi:hypothetical protein
MSSCFSLHCSRNDSDYTYRPPLFVVARVTTRRAVHGHIMTSSHDAPRLFLVSPRPRGGRSDPTLTDHPPRARRQIHRSHAASMKTSTATSHVDGHSIRLHDAGCMDRCVHGIPYRGGHTHTDFRRSGVRPKVSMSTCRLHPSWNQRLASSTTPSSLANNALRSGLAHAALSAKLHWMVSASLLRARQGREAPPNRDTARTYLERTAQLVRYSLA